MKDACGDGNSLYSDWVMDTQTYTCNKSAQN